MFTRTCTACTRRQLIFPSMLTGIERLEPTGPEGQGEGRTRVSYRCWCGSDQHLETDRLDQIMPTVAA